MIENDRLFRSAFPFWSELTPSERDALTAGSVPSVFPKGTVIHRAQQGCKGMLLLRSGQLRVYIVSPEGREVTLYRVRAGDACVLSTSCLMDSIEFDVLIEAMEDTQAVTIPSTVLAPIVQERPQVELYLYKTASERFSEVMWTIQQILFMRADRRVAIFLWDEVSKRGASVRLTHDEIARCIGSAREVVTRVLKYFAGEGIVLLERGRITVLEPEKLRDLAAI